MCEPERGRLTSQKEADLLARKRQTYEPERGRLTSQKGADVRARKRQTYELERGRLTSWKGADVRARKRQTYEPERGRRTKTRKSQTYESERGDVRSNLKEVELCLTAGGSPKGNTCGLPHPRSLFIHLHPILPNELETLHGVTSLFPLSYAARLRTPWSPPVIFPTDSYETL